MISTVEAPSNIAFIKYWGKRDPLKQWPANSSLSMTLKNSCTKTSAELNSLDVDEFIFLGKKIDSRSHENHKIFKHLRLIKEVFKQNKGLKISSENNFPHGCGIASSASGFAALTLASVSALTGAKNFEDLNLLGFSRSKLALLAKQGSGSAGRSLFGGFVKWNAGATPDEESILQKFNEKHWDLSDLIIIVSEEEKKYSSTDAHQLVWESPLFEPRLAGLPRKIATLEEAIQKQNMERLGDLIEAEALEMHAVALSGAEKVNYFLPQTVQLLSWIRRKRESSGFPAWFTMDAGPNIHLICQTKDLEQVKKTLTSEWPKLKTISDSVGLGPRFIH